MAARAALPARHDDQTFFEKGDWRGAAVQTVDATLDLKPGPNTIELVATNEGAQGIPEAPETARFGPFTVNYQPRPASPPAIRLGPLALLPETPGAEPLALSAEDAEAAAVTAPRLRVEGRITAEEGVTGADWRYAGGPWTPSRGSRGAGRRSTSARRSTSSPGARRSASAPGPTTPTPAPSGSRS